MFKVLKASWRSLSIMMSVLGILWFWPNIRDWPIAYGYEWGNILPQRETVMWLLLAAALLWIVWIDIRPLVRPWWRSWRGPLRISFPNEVNLPNKVSMNKKECMVYCSEESDKTIRFVKYLIGIENISNTKSVKNVKVIINYISMPDSLPNHYLKTESGETSVDISPGMISYFELGSGITNNIPYYIYESTAQTIKHISKTYDGGGFVVPGTNSKNEIKLLPNDGYKLVVGVYADDERALFEEFQIDARSEVTVTYIGQAEFPQ
ncbi:hypothetical protein [Aquibaculum sediminis]|uniref:hypothetical protein n=1 Tax=Aquibaculum sediminis TaxID=3231907 RepID=UPI003453EBCC